MTPFNLEIRFLGLSVKTGPIQVQAVFRVQAVGIDILCKPGSALASVLLLRSSNTFPNMNNLPAGFALYLGHRQRWYAERTPGSIMQPRYSHYRQAVAFGLKGV